MLFPYSTRFRSVDSRWVPRAGAAAGLEPVYRRVLRRLRAIAGGLLPDTPDLQRASLWPGHDAVPDHRANQYRLPAIAGVRSGATGGATRRDRQRLTRRRSEEHTSELQSLMRISYAVFCLKKKK